jgi:hydroxymethylbilane synthase
MSTRPLVLGTRGSHLARWQADHIEARLQANGHATEQRIIRTQGDRIQDLSFDKMEGKGFFTKELEAELLAGTIDLAVHSCKDLETRDPEGLHIAAIAGRAACEELLIIRREAVDATRPLMLRPDATVGTSSARRKSQLRMFRPDVVIADLRGNVPTRVDKLRAGHYDAILLAKAGIDRLGLDLSDLHVRVLDPRWFVPAPAQGALAVQTRTADHAANAAVAALHDEQASRSVALERAVLRGYHGGCQVPLGVRAAFEQGHYALWVAAARTWDGMPVRIHLRGTDPDSLAREAVERCQRTPRPLHALITRAVEDDGLLPRLLRAHGITLTGLSLLEPRPIPFDPVPDADRLFFTSRNAVRHFVAGGGDLHKQPCDAIGQGTAEELRRYGVEPAFTGDGPDTTAIATTYVGQHGGARVLFPCADKGLRTVQQAMPHGMAIDLHVYRMELLKPPLVPPADVVIVTSPEHARALHATCPVDRIPHRIAMGNSTARCIHELAGVNAVVPWASNELALADAVLNLATAP